MAEKPPNEGTHLARNSRKLDRQKPREQVKGLCRDANYGDEALERLERLILAETIDDVWTMLVEYMAEYSFDRLMYGLSYEAGTNEFVSLDDMLILSNHPTSYHDKFLGDGHHRNSPMLSWARTNTGPYLWSNVEKNFAKLSTEQRTAFEVNRQMGIVAGVTISFGATPPCGRSAMGMTARAGVTQDQVDATWEEHGRTILLLCNVAHLKIVTLPRTHMERKLTPRQRAVLRLVGAGKTAPEIARLMGVSTVTVEKHLRLAREGLGVETSAQALLKAAIQSQIFLPEAEP